MGAESREPGGIAGHGDHTEARGHSREEGGSGQEQCGCQGRGMEEKGTRRKKGTRVEGSWFGQGGPGFPRVWLKAAPVSGSFSITPGFF